MAMLVSEGGFRVELFELPGAAALPDERRHPATDLRTQGVKHVAYEVDDIEAFTERLRALGADIVLGPARPRRRQGALSCATTPATSVELVEPCTRRALTLRKDHLSMKSTPGRTTTPGPTSTGS